MEGRVVLLTGLYNIETFYRGNCVHCSELCNNTELETIRASVSGILHTNIVLRPHNEINPSK